MNSKKKARLTNLFKIEVSDRAKEIDPDYLHDWHSLTYDWAIAKGVDPAEAYKFANYIRYKTELGYIMTLKKWAKELVDESNGTLKRCYIAIMPVENWHLEVESVPMDTIAGCWDTNTMDVDEACKMADELQEELVKLGVHVCYTRKEWETETV